MTKVLTIFSTDVKSRTDLMGESDEELAPFM